MNAAYVARVGELRAWYNDSLLAMEEYAESKYANMAAVYRGKFTPHNGDSRALYDALAYMCMQSAWQPFEDAFQVAKDELFAEFQRRCLAARKEFGL